MHIEPRMLASWLREGPLLLLDVREDWEITVSAFPDALHVPMREIPARVDELPVDRPIVCICHHGARSAQVAMFLQHRGFEQVYNLAGGIDAWAIEVDATIPRY